MNISFESFSKKERGEIGAPHRAKILNEPEKTKSGLETSKLKSHYTNIAEESFLETASNNHRNLLKTQITVDGLENIALLLKSENSDQENKKMLSDIISNTHFQDERVLLELEDTLSEIVHSRDTEKLTALITEHKQTLLGLTTQENITQNILSTQSQGADKAYSQLLKDVVTQIKSKGTPHFNLQREKVLDLLR
ncbi:MAG: hypothetical protein JW822_10485 [Spirochaetales bacterium]|nr:hypothetical protein [Spirochaetales bacterium]